MFFIYKSKGKVLCLRHSKTGHCRFSCAQGGIWSQVLACWLTFHPASLAFARSGFQNPRCYKTKVAERFASSFLVLCAGRDLNPRSP